MFRKDPEFKQKFGEIDPKTYTLEDFKKERWIAGAEDFRLLSHILDRIGDIVAPDGYVYQKDKIEADILAVLVGKEPLQKITRLYGLRAKVKELLEKMEREKKR